MKTEGPRPGGLFILAGKSAEEGLNESYLHKLKTGEYLKSREVRDRVGDYWNARRNEYIIDKDIDEGAQKDGTVSVVECYHENLATKIEPVEDGVQRERKIIIPDKPPIWITPDLITDLSIIDWKVTFTPLKYDERDKTKFKPKHPHYLQCAPYSLVEYPKRRELCELHYMFPDKKPGTKGNKLDYAVVQFTPNMKLFQKYYEEVLKGIQNDIYIPNREHYLCSYKFCGWYEQCYQENG